MSKFNFDNEEVDLVLTKMTDEIRRKNDQKNDRWLVRSEFSHSLGSSPESCPDEEEGLGAISRDLASLTGTKTRLRFNSESLASIDLNENMKESLLKKF